MENHNTSKTTMLRQKVHSLRRRQARKSQGVSAADTRKPTCLNLNKAEKPPSVSPKTAKQQAFRQYSTKGFVPRDRPVNFESINKSNQYKTLMNETNVSSVAGLKSISTEPSNPQGIKGTRQILVSNPLAKINQTGCGLDLDNIYLHTKGKNTSVNRQNRSKISFPFVELDTKPQTVKGSRVFNMLKTLDLQQYSRKFVELGYDNDLCKLAFLNKKQRKDFISNLKPLPGHKDKLSSMFTMLDEIFEKEGVSKLIRHTSTSKRNRQQSMNQISHPKESKREANRSQFRKSSTHVSSSKPDGDASSRPTGVLKKKYLGLRTSVKSEINDKFITHFSTFQQKKKRKLNEILEKRNKIDHNCQLALNCIYNLNSGSIVPSSKHKSAISTIRKERPKPKNKDSISRGQKGKQGDSKSKRKSRISTVAKPSAAGTQNSSACRSGSKGTGRLIRKSSKLKVKRTARHPRISNVSKPDLQTQGVQGKPKSIEKHSLKNTGVSVKSKPGLHVKDRSNLKSKETKSRFKDTAKKLPRTGKNDKRMTQSANRYAGDASAISRRDSNTKIGKPEYKLTKRSMTKENMNTTHESSNRRQADASKDGLSTSIKILRKRYESAHKHRTQRGSLLPEVSQKALRSHITNEGSHSKSKTRGSKKRGSVKTGSQVEYGNRLKDPVNGFSMTQLQKETLLGQNLSYNVKSSSNLNQPNEKLIKYSESYYKNKSKRSVSHSSNSKTRKSLKYGSHNKTQVTKGMSNLSVNSRQSKDKNAYSLSKGKKSARKSTSTNKKSQKSSVQIISVKNIRTEAQPDTQREKSLSDSSDDHPSFSSDEIETPIHNQEVPYPDLDSSPSHKESEDESKSGEETSPNPFMNLVPEKPMVASSPILLPQERKQAKEFGYSLDTKLLNDEFFYIDLDKMCYCLAIAIQRQIHFSRGFLFLDDLASYLKGNGDEDGCLDPDQLSMSENELRFSYQFPDHLKLNKIDPFQSIRQDGNRSSEETCNIKKALDMDEEDKNCIFPDINVKDSTEELEKFLQKEGYSRQGSNQASSKKESPTRLISLMQGSGDGGKVNRQNKYCNPESNPDEADETMYEEELPEDEKDDFKLDLHQEPQYPKTFNLPSIVNSCSRKQSQEDSEPVDFQNETQEGLSPDITKRKLVKGLHDYEGNKENMINTNSPQEKSFSLAIKPVPLKNPGANEPPNVYQPPLDDEEPLEASSLFESVYVMDQDSDKIKSHLKQEMQIFDLAYDIEKKEKLHLTPEEKQMVLNPTFDDILSYIKYVAFKSKMEAEIPIISLIYIEKLLRKCGVLVNIHNWRRVVLITLCIGSKIWDDDSLENIHFPKVMSDITLKDISTLEKAFLNLVEYDVIIKGKEYAKYYFIMTTLGEESKKNPPWRLMNPSNVSKIEGESHRIQKQLKERYE